MSTKSEIIEILNNKSVNVSDNEDYKPILFELKNEDDCKRFKELFLHKPEIKVYDKLQEQLQELVKLRNPSKKLALEELNVEIVDLLNGVSEKEYGVWVYYPWSERLVHVLNEAEFIEIRTSRNCYKITPVERDVLSTKIVGIIGLSVGQSVALTMAMERVCGELRLADFDQVELSNMNRIRVGVHDLNVKKVVCAAREIAEIDPFIKVSCFQEGINESNIDDFMTGNGKLDVLVEVCDGIDMKIISRLKARQFGIPVVMDTNDRGMLDIERFDLERDRPIFHGRTSQFDKNLDSVKEQINLLNPQQRFGLTAQIVGMENISERMKFSIGHLGKTITSWPQLASSVVMGGGMATNVCRRMMLGQINNSGRYFVDLDEVIKDSVTQNINFSTVG